MSRSAVLQGLYGIFLGPVLQVFVSRFAALWSDFDVRLAKDVYYQNLESVRATGVHGIIGNTYQRKHSFTVFFVYNSTVTIALMIFTKEIKYQCGI